jgi:hypothetical protein|nr:MAG TPA: hypothetical protein [Caudoviricetes sp.]
MIIKFIAFDGREFDNRYACEEYERESEYDAMFNDSPKNCLTHLMKYIKRHMDGLPQMYTTAYDEIMRKVKKDPCDICTVKDKILYFRFDVVKVLLERIKEFEND